MIFLRALPGTLFFVLVARLISPRKVAFPWRVVPWGIAMQAVIAALIPCTPFDHRGFELLGEFVETIVSMTEPGAKMVFGSLAAASPSTGFIFAFAGCGLLAIIFFSALMSLLYHIGLMPLLVWAMAKVMSVSMGTSGAESMANVASIFLGQTEAPLVVKPYIARMTLSELNALMIGGAFACWMCATIGGLFL